MHPLGKKHVSFSEKPSAAIFLIVQFSLVTHVFSVAERFILRQTATAQSDTIADRINSSVLIFYRDTAFHPDRAVNAESHVFEDTDAFGQFRFDTFSVFRDSCETSAGTVGTLLFHDFNRFRPSRPLPLVPRTYRGYHRNGPRRKGFRRPAYRSPSLRRGQTFHRMCHDWRSYLL